MKSERISDALLSCNLSCECSEPGIAEVAFTSTGVCPAKVQDSPTASAEDNFRGMVSMILLFDLWPHNGSDLAVENLSAKSSPNMSFLLNGLDSAWMLMLADDERRIPLGILDEENLIIPGKSLRNMSDMVPSQCSWYVQNTRRFLSPQKFLSPVLRSALAARLRLFTGERITAFREELERYPETIRGSWSKSDYEIRWNAVNMLRELPVFSEKITCREERLSLTDNIALRTLHKSEQLPQSLQFSQETWCWDGLPFAWEDSQLHLIPTLSSDENKIMDLLRENLFFVKKYLVQWNKLQQEKIAEDLQNEEFPAIPADVLRCAMERDRNHSQLQIPEFTEDQVYPEAGFQSLMVLFFGDSAASLSSFFSQCLLLIPESAAVSAPFTFFQYGKYRALPPVSGALAEEINKGKIGLTWFTVDKMPDGSLSASMTLQGSQQVMCRKNFPGETSIFLASSDITTSILYPAVNLPGWHDYWIFQSEEANLQLVPSSLCADKPVSAIRCRNFPNAVCAFHKGRSCGALLLNQPAAAVGDAGNAAISVDIGMTGTAAAVKIGNTVMPLSSLSLTMPLLLGSDSLELQRRFIPMQPVPSVVSSAFIRAENDTNSNSVFSLGCCLVPQNTAHIAEIPAEKLSVGFLQSSDCSGLPDFLIQLMEQLSLNAALLGASGVSWIFTVSGFIHNSDEIQAALLSSAQQAASETGMKMNGLRLVSSCESLLSFASRQCADENVAALNLGSADIHAAVKLSAMSRAASSISVNWGMQSALLIALYQCPHSISSDFAHVGSTALLSDLSSLEECALHMNDSQSAFDKCGLLLDVLMGQHLAEIQQYMNICHTSGTPTLLRSQMLLIFALSLTMAGAALEKIWQDDVLKNSLPGKIQLYLAGRGCLLMLTVSDDERSQLPRFLQVAMSPNISLSSIVMVPSQMPKMELALGSFDAPQFSGKNYGGTAFGEIILRRFLSTFASSYPAEFSRLFGSLIQPDIYGNPVLFDPERMSTVVSHNFSKGIGSAQSFADAIFELEAMS